MSSVVVEEVEELGHLTYPEEEWVDLPQLFRLEFDYLP
jgi:hypothetical protein